MNKWIGLGFCGKDPEVKYGGTNNTCIARYSLAVRRQFAKDGEEDTDWINCVAFGRNAEFAEKYLRKGTKIIVEGRIQTGSYTNKDGQKVYTTDVVIENQEFAESKKSSEDSAPTHTEASQTQMETFMNVPDIEEELPFN